MLLYMLAPLFSLSFFFVVGGFALVHLIDDACDLYPVIEGFFVMLFKESCEA